MRQIALILAFAFPLLSVLFVVIAAPMLAPVDTEVAIGLGPAFFTLWPALFLIVVLWLYRRSNPNRSFSVLWLSLVASASAAAPVVWLLRHHDLLVPAGDTTSFAITTIPAVYMFGLVLGFFLGWTILWFCLQFFFE